LIAFVTKDGKRGIFAPRIFWFYAVRIRYMLL